MKDTSNDTPQPQPQMVGWQDISTAPKTGEEFIARTGPEWSSFSCSWDGEMFVHYDRDDGIIAYGPKQWMPMPGPDAAPESPSDLSVGERLQDLEHLLESVRACYFVGRPDCPNEFVQSTWEKVKAADDARAALAPATAQGGWMNCERKQMYQAKKDGTAYLLETKPGGFYVGSFRVGQFYEPNPDVMAWRSESGSYATPVAFYDLPVSDKGAVAK